MGLFSKTRWTLGTLLVGSAALAQQGLIQEPWRMGPPVPPAQAAEPRAMPDSGLPSLRSAVLAPAAALPSRRDEERSGARAKRWTPPVVDLLVDPWAKRVALRPAVPRWVPQTKEIIDPWAERAADSPSVAVGRTDSVTVDVASERTTIF